MIFRIPNNPDIKKYLNGGSNGAWINSYTLILNNTNYVGEIIRYNY